jgi:hypothetical protein
LTYSRSVEPLAELKLSCDEDGVLLTYSRSVKPLTELKLCDKDGALATAADADGEVGGPESALLT